MIEKLFCPFCSILIREIVSAFCLSKNRDEIVTNLSSKVDELESIMVIRLQHAGIETYLHSECISNIAFVLLHQIFCSIKVFFVSCILLAPIINGSQDRLDL